MILRKSNLSRGRSNVNFLDARFAPNRIALISYTSGTTGKPKMIPLTHKALIFQSERKLKVMRIQKSEFSVNSAPLSHIGGISSCHALISGGATQLFISSPKFTAKKFCKNFKLHSSYKFYCCSSHVI
jgi:acyl-activating enzyme 14